MPHTIHLLPSGEEFLAAPEESVLEAALRQDIKFPYGCKNGACGSCKGKVVSGRIQYPAGLPEAISDKEAALGWALFCQARAMEDLTVEVEEPQAEGTPVVRTLPCRVERKEQLAEDVMALYLKLPDGQRFEYRAGQYIDILLKDGRRRAFSLASRPAEGTSLELHIRRVPGGEFSDQVFDGLGVKALLRIRGPLGAFYLREGSDRPVVFVVGGTGFAPVKGIVEYAFAKGIDRPMHLYWGARSRQDLYLHELPQQWAADHDNFHYVPVLSEPEAEDAWSGRIGLVHEAVLADIADLTHHEVYASGPPAMVYAARDDFIDRGLDPANIHSDAFEYAHVTGHNA